MRFRRMNKKVFRYTLFFGITLLVVPILSQALAASREETSSGLRDETKFEYLRQVREALNELELKLDGLRQGGLDTASIESYMSADDLELLARDIRGDLLKLEATQSPIWGNTRDEIDAKLTEFQTTVAMLETPSRRVAEIDAR